MLADSEFLDAILFIAILIPSVILHEVAHGFVAHRLGDPTARRAGRLTLNPIRHVDPVGSLLVPGMLALSGQNVFGWAKPVPVDPGHFEHPTRGMALTALAGPATNLGLVLVVGALGPFRQVGDSVAYTAAGTMPRLLFGLVVVNAALAVFNLLPIPPLDGSRLLPLVLNDSGKRLYARAAPYGFFALLALVLVFDEALGFLGVWIRRVVLLAI